MFKRKNAGITKAEFDTIVSIMKTESEARRDADQRAVEYCVRMHEYHEQLLAAYNENNLLVKENGYLKALFEKEGDTNMIKYNGKLYRIASINHYKEASAEETLDISCICAGEVN